MYHLKLRALIIKCESSGAVSLINAVFPSRCTWTSPGFGTERGEKTSRYCFDSIILNCSEV